MSSTVTKLGILIISTITPAIICTCISGIFVFADSRNESSTYEEVVTAYDDVKQHDGTSYPKIFNHSDSFLEFDVRHTWGGCR